MNKRKISLLYFLWCLTLVVGLALAPKVEASIVMMGTRVIYHESQGEKSVQFTNNGEAPYILQVWTDSDPKNSDLELAKSPFIITPQVARVDPNRGQVARLMLLDKSSLPEDRESVFYLRFSQIPGIKEGDENNNQLLIVFTSVVKIFYRPKSLSAINTLLTSMVTAKIRDGALDFENNSPYYISLTKAVLKNGQNSLDLSNAEMIPPFSSRKWPLVRNTSLEPPRILELSYLNDFGAVEQIAVALD